MNRQRPIKGGREKLPAAVEARIYKRVEREARRFDCSRAFVVSTALAIVFGIDVDEKYTEVERRKK
jgi:hypothetical protein